MFSRTGASTIAKHKVFKSDYADINELVHDARTRKGYVPKVFNDEDNEDDEEPHEQARKRRLPTVTENENNMAVIEVPGLAEELRKVEKSYRKIKVEEPMTSFSARPSIRSPLKGKAELTKTADTSMSKAR